MESPGVILGFYALSAVTVLASLLLATGGSALGYRHYAIITDLVSSPKESATIDFTMKLHADAGR